MMQSFLKFIELGLYHVINFEVYELILFLIVISISFLLNDWKRLITLISVFTLTYSLSLILGLYDVISLNINVTEWLIPIVIFFVAVYNIFTAAKSIKHRLYLLYGIVFFFSIIHGLGFANTFETFMQSEENTILSVLEFSVGIEIGQFIVVICTLLLSYIFQSVFRFSNRDWILVVSCIILGFILPLILMTPIFS